MESTFLVSLGKWTDVTDRILGFFMVSVGGAQGRLRAGTWASLRSPRSPAPDNLSRLCYLPGPYSV